MLRKRLIRSQEPQGQPETPISLSKTPCIIKNDVCVPKCSELSEEQFLQGVQCALGKPWKFQHYPMFILKRRSFILKILHSEIIKHLQREVQLRHNGKKCSHPLLKEGQKTFSIKKVFNQITIMLSPYLRKKVETV